MRKKLNAEQLQWFIENYPELGGLECSTILHMERATLNHIANEHGIKVLKTTKIRHIKDKTIKRREMKIENIKSLVFNSPEQVYTLGFLWGDGYLVNCSHISDTLYYPELMILSSDFSDISQTLESIGVWNCKKSLQHNGKERIRARLGDSTMGYFLKMHNYDKKSIMAPTSILSVIPKHLHKYWLRGYIDADGCFYVLERRSLNQFVLAGSYEQDWSEIENIFRHLNIGYKIHHIKRHSGNYSRIQITNKHEIVKLGDFIYDNIDIGLKRKREKYYIIEKSTKRFA